MPHHDVAIPQMPPRGSDHQFHVDGEAHRADDGTHAQHDSHISAIMRSSLCVPFRVWSRSGSEFKYSSKATRIPAGVTVGRLSLLIVAFVLCEGVSPVTGKADELGFQAVPSSMPAVAWTWSSAPSIVRMRSCFVCTFAQHVSHFSLIKASMLSWRGSPRLEGLITDSSRCTTIQVFRRWYQRRKQREGGHDFSRLEEVRPNEQFLLSGSPPVTQGGSVPGTPPRVWRFTFPARFAAICVTQPCRIT